MRAKLDRAAPVSVGGLTAVGAGALVFAVGRANGGYFPTTWAWIVLALGWAACLALLLRDRVELNALDVAALAGLALFVLWVAASVAWSDDRSQTVSEVERDLVYVVGVLAGLVVVRVGSVAQLLGGLLAGVAAVDGYALGTRLFHAAGSGLDPIVLNQLSQPLGYPNGLGILTVLGVFLAFGVVARGQLLWARTAAGAALPVLLATLYFTYSRGAWIAFFAAAIAMVVLDPRRLQLVTAAAAVAPWSALAVWLSSREHGLTSLTGSSGEIRTEGRQLCAVLLVLAVASTAAAFLVARVERRAAFSPAARRIYAAALTALALIALVSAFVRYGDPVDLGRRAYDSFRTPPSSAPSQSRLHNNLNERLFTLNGTYRVQQWDAAWDDYNQNPWLGSGAGSFEHYWLQHRTIDLKVRDAHSLYMETVAELGWVGLLLLAAALAAPLVAAVRARRNPLVPIAFGAYVAYLLHTGVDWDWELPAVTLAGLLCGVALLVCARESRPGRLALSPAARAGIAAAVILVAAFSVVGLAGNRALASATSADDQANWNTGTSRARAAIRWMPWSGQAWQQLGDAQLGLGDRRAARASLLKAARMSPGDWSIWFDLGTATRGPERERAYRKAAALNPLDPNLQQLRTSGH